MQAAAVVVQMIIARQETQVQAVVARVLQLSHRHQRTADLAQLTQAAVVVALAKTAQAEMVEAVS
jgi:hypothetical protein